MKMRKLISVMLAVVLAVSMMCVTTASAADRYREQIWKYNEMKNNTIKVALDFSGGYVLKSTKAPAGFTEPAGFFQLFRRNRRRLAIVSSMADWASVWFGSAFARASLASFAFAYHFSASSGSFAVPTPVS